MWKFYGLRYIERGFSHLNRASQLASKLTIRSQIRNASIGPASGKPVLPERALLYHAGTGRIVLIGSIKMTTIFFFCFSVGVIAPWQYNLPESPAWMPLAVIVGGSIPMLVVMRTTAPFVTYAHLKLPFHARRSRDHVAKFVEKVPPHTEIDLTTIGNFGWAHVYRMPLFELRKTKYRFSVANLRRVPSFLSQTSKRAWWKGSLPTNFYIADERVRRGSSTLWQRVLEQLKTA